jgi:hypothetical protein
MPGLLNSRGSRNVLEHAANHVFLPPKLPQEAESESLQKEMHLLMCQVALHAIEQAQQSLPLEDRTTWTFLQEMLIHLHDTIQTPLAVAQLKDYLVHLPIGGKWRSVGQSTLPSVNSPCH